MSQLTVATTSPYESRTDAELVRAVVDADERALRVVWNRYVTAVRSTLRSCLGSDHAIDDLTQEVFLSFFKSAARLRDPELLRPYLLGTASRLALLELRTRTRRNRWHRLFHLSLGDDAPYHLPDVDDREALGSLGRVLQSLPDRECQAFILRYVQDLSPLEVAVALKIPLGSAKRAISVGRKFVVKKAENHPALTGYLRRCRGVT